MLSRKTFWLIKCDFFRLFHTERSWHAYWFSAVIVPGNIVDFWNSDFLKKSQLDLPSAWIFFLYLLLCMNFFSWHFPLQEFFFGFFPTPHITFLMVRPLWGLLVCMSGHEFWPCVFFQFYSMYFFTLIQYKINVVVVCSFRARESPEN